MNDIQLLILGGVCAFLLHFIGKWKETTDTFLNWLWNKQSVIYWTSSLLLCVVSFVLREEVSELVGMKPATFVIVSCYGGGHIVSRIMGIKAAETKRKALKG